MASRDGLSLQYDGTNDPRSPAHSLFLEKRGFSLARASALFAGLHKKTKKNKTARCLFQLSWHILSPLRCHSDIEIDREPGACSRHTDGAAPSKKINRDRQESWRVDREERTAPNMDMNTLTGEHRPGPAVSSDKSKYQLS